MAKLRIARPIHSFKRAQSIAKTYGSFQSKAHTSCSTREPAIGLTDRTKHHPLYRHTSNCPSQETRLGCSIRVAISWNMWTTVNNSRFWNICVAERRIKQMIVVSPKQIKRVSRGTQTKAIYVKKEPGGGTFFSILA